MIIINNDKTGKENTLQPIDMVNRPHRLEGIQQVWFLQQSWIGLKEPKACQSHSQDLNTTDFTNKAIDKSPDCQRGLAEKHGHSKCRTMQAVFDLKKVLFV
jgi:hypothetical protein